jgi:hypothetical protein
MASMNIEMRLDLVDTASAPVKAFISTLGTLETAVSNAAGKMSAFAAAMKEVQSSLSLSKARMDSAAQGISSITAAASNSGAVSSFAAAMNALGASMGIVKSNASGVATSVGNIGTRANAAVGGTTQLNNTITQLNTALQNLMTHVAGAVGGMNNLNTAARTAGGGAANAMNNIGNGAQNANRHVTTLADTLKGTMQMWAAHKIANGLKESVSEAAEYERTDNRLRNMKLKPDESDAIHKSVRQTGRDFAQFDQNELLEMAIDLRNATGSAHEAAEGLKGFAQSVFAINLSMPSGKKLDEQGTLNFAKFLEGRGVTMDPAAMEAQQNLVTKIVAATQGRVNPNNLFGNLTYAKGGLGRTMDDEALVTFAAMIEQDTIGGGTGGRVGTMLTSFVNSITKSNAITTKNRDEWMKLGLVDPGKVNVNENTNRVTSIQAGAIAGTEIVGKNFKRWVDEYLRPALIAAGVNMDDLNAVKAKTDVLFPNRNAAEAAFQLLSKKELIEKDSANINQAAGKDEQVANGQKLSAANWERFHKAINDLAIAIGTSLLPVLNPLLEGFTKIIQVLGQFSSDHPVFGFLLGLVGAAAGVSLALAGLKTLFGVTFGGLVSLIGKAVMEAGSLFMGFAGVIAEAGRFIAVVVRMILGGFTPLGWIVTAIVAAWELGLGDWISKLNVFGRSVGDWATILSDRVVNDFKNMWIRTKEFFGFLSKDAADAQVEANNRARIHKLVELSNAGAKPATRGVRGGASGDWDRGEEVSPAAKATEEQVKREQEIAAQIKKNKEEAEKLVGGGKAGGRFANYDINLDDAKNDLRLEEDELARHMKAEDELYKANKISINDYYDDKLATMRKSINAQIAELERERAAYQRQGDRAGANRAGTEIELRKRDLADTEKSVAVQREKDLNELKEKGLALDAQILEAEGKRHQAQRARDVQRAEKEKAYFEANRDAPGAAGYIANAQKVIDIAKLTAAWEEYGDAVKKVHEETQTKEAAVDAEVKSGNLTKYEAEQKLFKLRRDEAAQLDELIAKEKALIEASDAPQGVKDQRLKTLDLAQARANATMSEMNPDDMRVKQTLDSGLQGSFTGLFRNIISGSKSASSAFKQFGNDIANVVNQLVAEQLGKQLFQSLFGQGGVNMGGMSGGGASGGGSIFGSGGFLGGLFGGGSSAGGAVDANADITMVNGASEGGFWSGIASWFASLDVGTDNVPQDMLAQIHQGEMIIPKYDADRIRSGGFKQGPAHVTNNFTVAGSVTRETQSQIALQAALGVQRATRRNG